MTDSTICSEGHARHQHGEWQLGRAPFGFNLWGWEYLFWIPQRL